MQISTISSNYAGETGNLLQSDLLKAQQISLPFPILSPDTVTGDRIRWRFHGFHSPDPSWVHEEMEGSTQEGRSDADVTLEAALLSFHSSEYFWWSLCLLMFTVTTLIKELSYRRRTVFPDCLPSQKNSFSCQILVLFHYLFLCVCFHR